MMAYSSVSKGSVIFPFCSAGAIPGWVGELENLEVLDLAHNNFDGEQWVLSGIALNVPCVFLLGILLLRNRVFVASTGFHGLGSGLNPPTHPDE